MMRIKITTTFTDLQAADPEHAEVSAGTEMTVTAERGAELVRLGLAIDTAPPAPRRKRDTKRSMAKKGLADPAPAIPVPPAAAPPPTDTSLSASAD